MTTLCLAASSPRHAVGVVPAGGPDPEAGVAVGGVESGKEIKTSDLATSQ